MHAARTDGSRNLGPTRGWTRCGCIFVGKVLFARLRTDSHSFKSVWLLCALGWGAGDVGAVDIGDPQEIAVSPRRGSFCSPSALYVGGALVSASDKRLK